MKDDARREPLEVVGMHLYRIREVFNEYEETYLGGPPDPPLLLGIAAVARRK